MNYYTHFEENAAHAPTLFSRVVFPLTLFEIFLQEKER